MYPRPEKSVVRYITSTVSSVEIPVALTVELDIVTEQKKQTEYTEITTSLDPPYS